jgi:predicted PurR-regulated permease PerM
MASSIHRSTSASWATLFLAVLAALYTAHLAKPVLAPIAIAVLLKFLLAPWIRGWNARFGVPTALSAALLVAVGVGGIAAAAVTLAPTALRWAEELPDRMRRLEDRLGSITEPVAAISAATEKVGKQVDDLTAGDAAPASEPPVVRIKEPGWLATALTAVKQLLLELFVTIVLLYLLLVSDGHVMAKLRMSGNAKAAQWADTLRNIERRISMYVSSLLVVHTGVGVCTGLAAWWFGLSNPVLWGVIAAVGNMIPYVGPTTVAGLLALVGLTTFDTLGPALLPAGAYVLVHALESNLVTPCLLGRWLSLSPVAIFVALLVMGFVWGIAGLVLAVPVLVVVKICCEQVPRMQTICLAIEGTRRTCAPVPAVPDPYWLSPQPGNRS